MRDDGEGVSKIIQIWVTYGGHLGQKQFWVLLGVKMKQTKSNSFMTTTKIAPNLTIWLDGETPQNSYELELDKFWRRKEDKGTICWKVSKILAYFQNCHKAFNFINLLVG